MDKKPKPVSAIPPFGLRMQPALKASLEESAKQNARSLNAEIVARLESSTNEEEPLSDSQRAMLRVLKLDDRMILNNRVLQLGGIDSVLNTPIQEIQKRLEGPSIERSQSAQKSFFSNLVGQIPLTAILSTDELNAIATRIIQMQEAHDQSATSNESETQHDKQQTPLSPTKTPSRDIGRLTRGQRKS